MVWDPVTAENGLNHFRHLTGNPRDIDEGPPASKSFCSRKYDEFSAKSTDAWRRIQEFITAHGWPGRVAGRGEELISLRQMSCVTVG